MMKHDIIPLNWIDIMSTMIIIAISVAFLSWEEFRTESPFHAVLAVILIAVMLWALWGLTERRELDAEGIHRFRFGKEIRTIRWDQVQQLGILLQERQHRRGISQLYLVVIPKWAEPFAPDMETGYGYLSRNRRQILTEQIKYAPIAITGNDKRRPSGVFSPQPPTGESNIAQSAHSWPTNSRSTQTTHPTQQN